MNYSYLFFVLMACWVRYASCLSCYECDTWGSDDCDDPFKTTNVATSYCGDRSSKSLTERLAQVTRVNISGVKDIMKVERGDPAIVCVKAKMENPDGDMVIWRACNYLGDGTCKSIDEIAVRLGLDTKFCEICTKDGCNGAGSLHFVPILVAMFGVLLRACS